MGSRVCHEIKILAMKRGPMILCCLNVYRNRIQREKKVLNDPTYPLFRSKIWSRGEKVDFQVAPKYPLWGL